MALTPAQDLILSNDILVTNAAVLQPWIDAVDDQSIAGWYNSLTVPTFWVYPTALSKAAIMQETSADGTTFTFVGNGFITRSVQELLVWQELFSLTGTVDTSKLAVQNAFRDIFSGSGNAAANRAHVAAMARRPATRLERLFAMGQGTPAAPGVLTVEGEIDYLGIAKAYRGVGV